MVKSFLRVFSTRASSSTKAALDPPSLAPTNRKSRNRLVSKCPANTMRSGRAPGIVAIRFTMCTWPAGVASSQALLDDRNVQACKLGLDVLTGLFDGG